MRMKVLWVLLLCGGVGFFASSCGKKAGEGAKGSKTPEQATVAKGAVLAKVGDKVITMGDFEAGVSGLPEYTRSKLNTKDAKKRQLDRMIDEDLLMREAKRRGLDSDPDIQKKLDNYRNRLVSEKLYQVVATEGGTQISEDEITKYFDEHKDQFEEKERIRVSQVMIMVPPNAGPDKEKEAKDKAEQALKRAKKGEDFAKLAQEYSEGPMASKGGDLGYISKGRMMPEFENVAFSLKNIGDVSDIVKTQFGYHIVKLTDRKAARLQTLDEVRDRIVKQIESTKRREVRQNLPQELRKKVAIVIHDDLLKDEPGAAPASPQAVPPGMPPGAVPGMPPGAAPGMSPGLPPGAESGAAPGMTQVPAPAGPIPHVPPAAEPQRSDTAEGPSK